MDTEWFRYMSVKTIASLKIIYLLKITHEQPWAGYFLLFIIRLQGLIRSWHDFGG